MGGELKEMDLGVLYWVRDVAKPEELPEFVIQVVDEWDAEDAERVRRDLLICLSPHDTDSPMLETVSSTR